MGRTTIASIQFTGANPSGGYISGDIVNIYYDPDLDPLFNATAGYIVEKNGLVITSGANILPEIGLPYTYKNSFYYYSYICNGTTGVTFAAIPTFPYTIGIYFPNIPTCAIVPVTCDLIVIGVPTVTGASSASIADGQITIVAQSSNPIQYRLNSDFIYGDGTAQSDGHFYVIPGTFRVYIRDSKNCATSVVVTIGIDNTYAPIYVLEYVDRLLVRSKIEIHKRAYAGSSSIVTGGVNPIQLRLRGEADNNKFTPLNYTEATVSLISETEGQFANIYTNSQKEYRVIFYKDSTVTLPPFVPASLPVITLWQQDSSGAGSWAAGYTIHLKGLKISNKKYQTYSFVEGETYSFHYQFQTALSSGAFVFSRFVIQITNASDADLGVNLVIDATNISAIYDDTYSFVCPAGADRIKIYVEQNNSTTINYYLNFFTNVTASHSGQTITDYSTVWIGNVLPQQYQENYMSPPYEVTILAKDGISDLANLDFMQDDGQQFFGRTKAMTLIAFCLQKTLLNLPIRCGINLYAADMNQTDTDDPLDQAYINPDSYYLSGNPNYSFVLIAILSSFRARLVQWNGRWNILRPEELIDAFDYRDFDKDGNFSANGTEDPVVNVDFPDADDSLNWVKAPLLEMRPGYGKARVIYHLGLTNNILRNGDFRVKSIFNPEFGVYTYTIDKFGFQLIAPYAISEGSEFLDSPNVAYTMSSNATVTTGEAALQSDVYSMAMGLDNTLKITVRYKIPVPIRYGLGIDDNGDLTVFIYTITLRYQKVRAVIKYGNRYLQSNGTWTAFYSECIFYATEFGKYTESQIIAAQPDATFTTAKDFTVTIFQSWSNHSEFATLAELKAKITGFGNARSAYNASSNLFPTTGGSGVAGAILSGDKFPISGNGVLGGVPVLIGYTIVALVNTPGQVTTNWFITNGSIQALPTGTKTELGTIYYELEENTDSADDHLIVRPDDYNVTTNPVQWILKGGHEFDQSPTIKFYLDKIQVEYLTNGQAPIDTIIRQTTGEPNNNLILEEDVYHGSLSNLITSNTVQGIQVRGSTDIFALSRTGFKNLLPRVSNFFVTQNILSAALIYTGYYSDVNGNGYQFWSRDSIAESLSLHEIFLKTTISQYSSSYKKLSGSLSGNVALGLNNTIREVQQSSRVLLPMSLTLNDKENLYEGEFLELINTSETGFGFTIGFSKGFNA